MGRIFTSDELKGVDRQVYYWNEYRFINGRIMKYRCKFEGNEDKWEEEEHLTEEWDMASPEVPIWLKRRIRLAMEEQEKSGNTDFFGFDNM